MSYLISGIQQVGVGCVSFEESWKWYIDMFGMDVRVLEDDTVAERMLRYTGGQPQKRHACIAVNIQGGGGLEIWQYSERKPEPCSFDASVGDLGVFAAKLKSRDVKAFREQLAAKYDKVGPICTRPDGVKSFFVLDPWGNNFEIVEDKSIFIEDKRLCGGCVGVMTGCTDIDRTIPLYRDVFGYDVKVYDETGTFEDLAFMNGGEGRFRRVLLTHSAERQGAFSGLYGRSSIELVQALDRTPRKLYEGRYWGDPGFIQVCFDVTNMRDLQKKCEQAGHPFTVDSCPNDERFDMGEGSGHFVYIEDPDGTLIELVEVQKITVLKKPHIYLNMLRGNRKKRLPKFLYRLMALNRVKF